MPPAVLVKHLQVSYGRQPVLRDLSLKVPAGAFFIIIGPNSSGKTTLLRAMVGVVKPQEGQVEIWGTPVGQFSKRALARLVAVVHQRAATDIPFTVQEVVLMGRSPHVGWLGLDRPRDLELAREAMVLTDVAHLAKRPLPQLSGGELQRVSIARALCQQPRLLLLDEPTAALDPAHQVNLMDLLAQLQQELGLTVVMVSHDLNLAAMYGEQLLLLKEGEVVQLGRPAEVLTYEQLERAYDCAMLVDENPLGNVPRVNLVPQKFFRPRGSGE
ncbi:MAG: ABC transporter ATP-binding protein [Deltaproteobacteria bacterium]|nr:ABC transporter ATP-binding protein [Deltaproteobacteria bacterium]